MTDNVAALVLEDNRLQALALSIAETGGAKAVASHIRLIETLEDFGGLDRKTEGLADGEALARRALEGQRPDAPRTRGPAVDHQARAAGRDRGERPGA